MEKKKDEVRKKMEEWKITEEKK
jgi:hypothetical protein